MPLVGCWILWMSCAQYILLLMFCGLGQHSGYSNLLWASLGCGIYHLPLSSAEVKENVELYLYSPCRPWTFYFFLKLFICLGRVAIVPLAEWSWVQILVGTKDFSLLQNIQTNSGSHPAGLPAWRSPCTLQPSGDTSSKSNISGTLDRPWWPLNVATKVPIPYSVRFLSVSMDEKRSLQRKSKHKRRIGRLHYEWCCPHKVRTPRWPQESYTYYCQESWRVHWSQWWDFWTIAIYWDHLHNQ